jgi:flavin reductase (DIM6/NTAB) family NADH-FMN oxidoreductase RutF
MEKLAHKFTYGYYILTALKKADHLKTREKDYIVAGTVNWATQVSFSPKIFSVAVAQQSDLNETIDYSEHFTLHVLSGDNKSHIKTFAEKSSIEDGKINGVPFKKKNGEAMIENTIGHVTCKVLKSENIGDHTIYFGEVIDEVLENDIEPICTAHVPIEYSKEKAEI